ncbi:MAG: dephospho-CoA kinase [Candidatus Binatia bacterium]|nr:MAG: dephospho-CoA kinase [Candidatus Binatia bacterium]
MKVIGLTGGIGSGKSAAANILRELGAEVIDADKLAHESYAPGTAGWEAVVAEFGREIVGPKGEIDRKKLGAIVFADPEARRRLERIVHPLVTAEIRRRLDALRRRGHVRFAVLEAALLLEAGWHELVDQVWLVRTAPELVQERLQRDRAMSSADIEARQRAQFTDDARLPYAHVVIDNSGTLEDLRAQLAGALARDC